MISQGRRVRRALRVARRDLRNAVRPGVIATVLLRQCVAAQPVKAALHSELRLVGLSDVGDHHGRMQPANRLRQLMIMTPTCAAPDLLEAVVRREDDMRRGLALTLDRLVEMRRGEDDHIPVPDGGDRKPAVGGDAHLHAI